MKLVNLTKDVCRLYGLDGEVIEIEPEAKHIGIVGVSEQQKVSDSSGNALSMHFQIVTDIKGMPPPQEGTIYIVPVEIAIALQGVRNDIAIIAEETHLNDLDGNVQRVPTCGV